MRYSPHRMDTLMGYSKPDPRDKWWFDLEEVDGKYQKPEPESKAGVINVQGTIMRPKGAKTFTRFHFHYPSFSKFSPEFVTPRHR